MSRQPWLSLVIVFEQTVVGLEDLARLECPARTVEERLWLSDSVGPEHPVLVVEPVGLEHLVQTAEAACLEGLARKVEELAVEQALAAMEVLAVLGGPAALGPLVVPVGWQQEAPELGEFEKAGEE